MRTGHSDICDKSTSPLPRDQRKTGAVHLNLLALFHFVGASFALLGIAFLAAHCPFMHAIFANPKLFAIQKQPMPVPPEQIFAVMKWFYLAGPYGSWLRPF